MNKLRLSAVLTAIVFIIIVVAFMFWGDFLTCLAVLFLCVGLGSIIGMVLGFCVPGGGPPDPFPAIFAGGIIGLVIFFLISFKG